VEAARFVWRRRLSIRETRIFRWHELSYYLHPVIAIFLTQVTCAVSDRVNFLWGRWIPCREAESYAPSSAAPNVAPPERFLYQAGPIKITFTFIAIFHSRICCSGFHASLIVHVPNTNISVFCYSLPVFSSFRSIFLFLFCFLFF
jgi:hypothetical protein